MALRIKSNRTTTRATGKIGKYATPIINTMAEKHDIFSSPSLS